MEKEIRESKELLLDIDEKLYIILTHKKKYYSPSKLGQKPSEVK